MLLKQGEAGLIFAFRFSFFDIRTAIEYPILTFKNPILTFALSWKVLFSYSKSYFHIHMYGLSGQSLFLYLKSNFDSHAEAEFKTLFWDSHLIRLPCFDIQNPILTLELSRKILFWHSRFYFDIRAEPEYLNLTFKIVFWYSSVGLDVIPCDFLTKIDFFAV